jgi:hypothetical protein
MAGRSVEVERMMARTNRRQAAEEVFLIIDPTPSLWV